MKTFKIIIFFGLIFAVFITSAQNNAVGGANQLQAQRIAFITERMNLTPEEAQQFWPLYNHHNEILKQLRKAYQLTRVSEDATDDQVEKFILSGFDKDQKEIELKKDYYQRLRKVLNVRKIQKLFRAEVEFRQEVIQQLKKVAKN